MSASNAIQSFPGEVNNSLGYYVYRLIDPRNGETFYIGKGCGNRVFSHACGEIEEDPADEKLSRIRDIQIAGMDVQHVIHRHGMDSDTAFEVEAALIDAYPGLTNIANGHGNDERGTMHAVEIMRRYQAADAEFKHKTLLITINRSAFERSSLYEATRKAWKLDPDRARKAEVILPVIRGMIVGAFIADEWYQHAANDEDMSEELREKGRKRYEFTGRQAPVEVAGLYVNKKVPAEFRKKGAANPIRYLGC